MDEQQIQDEILLLGIEHEIQAAAIEDAKRGGGDGERQMRRQDIHSAFKHLKQQAASAQ